MRDFAHEPMPNSSKAPEFFDPVPCLIAADGLMRNPDKNHDLLCPKALFRLIKMDWLTLEDVRHYFDPYDYVALAHYNDRRDKRRYPFVVASRNLPRRSACDYVGRRILLRIRTIAITVQYM